MTVVVSDARVALGGVEIAYREAGAGARPFVLVHGFTGTGDDFADHLPALGRLGRTLVPDLRGHGASSHAADAAGYTLEQLTDDLGGFLDALDVPACDLLGHSMGGMVALRFALAQPQRVHSLVCMNTAARMPRGLPRELFELGARVAREAGMEALLRIVLAQLEAGIGRSEADRRLQREWGDERYRARLRARFGAMDGEAFARLGVAMLDQESLLPRLGAVRVPTLVMVGAQDAAFLEPADELARAIPGARRVTIEDAGHQPQLEAPERWIEEIRQHLRRARDAA